MTLQQDPSPDLASLVNFINDTEKQSNTRQFLNVRAISADPKSKNNFVFAEGVTPAARPKVKAQALDPTNDGSTIPDLICLGTVNLQTGPVRIAVSRESGAVAPHFRGIIDIFDENPFDPVAVSNNGIVKVILHQTTQGCYKKNGNYLTRKQASIARGFLWAGYHLLSAEPVQDQINFFLSVEDGSDPKVALAIDWEASAKGTMSYERLREFVDLFAQRTGRHPILYGGNLLRETHGITQGDALLGRCPLWYARYTNGPLQIPTNTWDNYTLWQFDNEQKHFGAPTIPGVSGEDFNEYPGTLQDLTAVWPLTGSGVLAELHSKPPPSTFPPAAALTFEMNLKSASELLRGTLTVFDAAKKQLLQVVATSGLPFHQTPSEIWVSGRGPLPDVTGLTVATTLHELDTDGYRGPSFPIQPRKVAAPDGGISRGDFELTAAHSFEGTHGGLAVLVGEDFKNLVNHLDAARQAGTPAVPLQVTYQKGATLDPEQIVPARAVFTMDLHESDQLIMGLLVLHNGAGDEIFSAEATSGLRRWQTTANLWTRDRGPLPPNPDNAKGNAIETDEYYSQFIGGYALRITPEEVSNGVATRGAFRVHLDLGVPGSEGCIAIQRSTSFGTFRTLMRQLSHAGIKTIPLTLNYT